MLPQSKSPLRILVCPDCRGQLNAVPHGVTCVSKSHTFTVEPHGYSNFVPIRPHEGGLTTDDYVAIQHASAHGQMESYIRPWLEQEPFRAVLDVGCGIGAGISALVAEGVDAFGVDLPNLAPYWAKDGRSPDHFFCADALRLPFADNTFDAIWSLGVVEHIGTVSGNSLLHDDYVRTRRRYARELLRVLKPGGRVLIGCPNKRFPVDIQHAPGDPARPSHPVKDWIWSHAHVNVHRTWGRYYLPTYSDLEAYFQRPVTALPLRGYFGYQGFGHRALRPFLLPAAAYVDHLPTFLRRTPLNPYVLAEVRKDRKV